jgi:hypothetical protein
MSLVCTHNHGFFSCCTVKLYDIINYINGTGKLPESVDSSAQFGKYRPALRDDVTYDFFEQPISSEYTHTPNICFHFDHQFWSYYTLDFQRVLPIFKLYFEPSQRIKTITDRIVKEHNICHDKCIAVYYRGTDKSCETAIETFENFDKKLNELLATVNEDIQILVQTDTAQFLDYITDKHTKNNLIVVKELLPTYTNRGVHDERSNEQNYDDISLLLSIVTIMSKCKYIICSSGNVSLWMMMYRGNAKNVHQTLHHCWYTSPVC